MVDCGPLGKFENLCCGVGAAGGEHAKDCWTRDPSKLPWYPGWWKAFWSSSPFSRRRCTARTARQVIYQGRCELTEHEAYCDHALERGFDTPRWSTRWTA